MPGPTAQTIGQWLEDFMNGFEASSFHKSRDHAIKSERDLLKVLKFFLLAKYPNLKPEARAKSGRFDFLFEDTALEVVVRNKSGDGQLIVGQNDSEMRKLRTHQGLSVLALIDMEKSPRADVKKLITAYRGHSLGKGNHKKRPVNILYVHRAKGSYEYRKFVVRSV